MPAFATMPDGVIRMYLVIDGRIRSFRVLLPVHWMFFVNPDVTDPNNLQTGMPLLLILGSTYSDKFMNDWPALWNRGEDPAADKLPLSLKNAIIILPDAMSWAAPNADPKFGSGHVGERTSLLLDVDDFSFIEQVLVYVRRQVTEAFARQNGIPQSQLADIRVVHETDQYLFGYSAGGIMAYAMAARNGMIGGIPFVPSTPLAEAFTFKAMVTFCACAGGLIHGQDAPVLGRFVDHSPVVTALGGAADISILHLAGEYDEQVSPFDAIIPGDPSAVPPTLDRPTRVAEVSTPTGVRTFLPRNNYDNYVTANVLPAQAIMAGRHDVSAGYGLRQWRTHMLLPAPTPDFPDDLFGVPDPWPLVTVTPKLNNTPAYVLDTGPGTPRVLGVVIAGASHDLRDGVWFAGNDLLRQQIVTDFFADPGGFVL